MEYDPKSLEKAARAIQEVASLGDRWSQPWPQNWSDTPSWWSPEQHFMMVYPGDSHYDDGITVKMSESYQSALEFQDEVRDKLGMMLWSTSNGVDRASYTVNKTEEQVKAEVLKLFSDS
jgi:hypothetical protein